MFDYSFDRRSFVAAGIGLLGGGALARDSDLPQEIGVVSVKDFGAIGNGVTDDTTAIMNAINAVASNSGSPSSGGIVFLPPGSYLVSEDILVPQGVTVQGSGQFCTRILASASGTFANAVIDTNADGLFAVGLQLRDFQIHANKQDRGLLVRGFNEGCIIDGVHVTQFASEGIRIEPGQAPSTNITQNVTFGQIRITSPSATDADALVLDAAQRCTFLALSIDSTSSAGRIGVGIRMTRACRGNLFLRTHVEDCALPILMGEDNPCQNNKWIGLHVTNPSHGPTSQDYGNLSGTMAIVQGRSAGSQSIRNSIEQFSLNYDYDYDFVDAEDGFSVPSSGSVERYHTRIETTFDESGNRLRSWDSRTAVPMYTTATLPSADSLEDQTILIEDGGSGHRNLIIYAGGQRFRIYGGSAI